jgi:bacteriophage N4 adsorption protein B
VPGWLRSIDAAVIWCLTPLAVAILVSGLDDLIVDLAWGWHWLKARFRPAARLFPPGTRQLDSAPLRRIAILLPLWKEHEVIARMLEHNLGAIRYPNYHIFAGAYPNDHLTQSAVRSVTERFKNVHLALCPHNGPTSKADCLNWVYQHLALYEERHGERFDVVVVHDAEDIVHPEELRWINLYSARYDFIQTPVLALPTPFWALTHGVYCDEFAEYHTRDMGMRPLLGGFLPSSGVATGYRREALEKLAETSSNCIFEPDALAEDYENGLKLFRLGCSQAFVPILTGAGGDVLATREYFPQTWHSALRQRTRWLMGIALQGWRKYGWRGTPGEVYWLWRDRKGLIANPLSCLANVVFLYGLTTAMWTRVTPLASELAMVTVSLQALRTTVRMGCVARIYGIRFALGVPLRTVYANALNSAATVLAVARYAIARMRKRPLVWLKTDHHFPSRAALLGQKRKLGEILVGSGYLNADALLAALETQADGVRLGDYLIRTGRLDEESVYEALSLQQGLPLSSPDPREIPRRVAHAIPEQLARQWKVLPFRVAEGNLDLASPDLPSVELAAALRSFTALEIRFHLVTPRNFATLAEALL